MSYSQFTSKDYEVIAREYADLKESSRKRCASAEELDVVQKAFEFANEAHKNVRRRSGEPYILHPIAVGKIVVNEIGLGYKSITAALLHDVVEDTDYTVDDIRQLFGDKVATLVEGLTKIKTVLDDQDRTDHDGEFRNLQSMQAENFKRILLTLNDDVRVVLIKLADRLHNCRTIEYMPEYKRDKILSETRFVFIPLAHRLGLYSIKSEMENIWLRFKEPEAYNTITAKVNRDMTDKGREIDKFIRPIEEALDKAGFDFEVRKRVKTPYSIWNKMNTKNVSFEQVYDLYAVRIIFNPAPGTHDTERDQCYHIFSIITGIYRYKPDRMRDWVKHPKSNGYEALHCTLMSDRGMWVEVQIRSKRMDDIAEKGIAAHWAYKKDGYTSEYSSEMDKWLDKVKDILVSPDVNALELLDIIHKDLTSSDIVVFTPKGEQKSIQKGATAIDFAYMIHTHIGNRAIAAKANLKLVPLSYVLKTGDTIEIITAESAKPKKEWLQFIQTRYARNKLMDYFRSDKAGVAASGRAALALKLESMDVILTDTLAKFLSQVFELNNVEELFFRYGMGVISFESIVQTVDLEPFKGKDKEKSTADRLLSYLPWRRRAAAKAAHAQAEVDQAAAAATIAGSTPPKGKFDRTAFTINSPSDPHKYILATCCKPIHGDTVIGFLAPDGSVTVHKKSCQIAEEIASKHGDWIVMPRWDDGSRESFQARVSMRGIDRIGLLSDITREVSIEMSLNMKAITLSTEDGLFEGQIDFIVADKDVLYKLIGRLRNIDGIQEVGRVDIK
ncbi:MAG: bifunctional (p)ppGpp synthetase/guanosine-3',5'-bis(diphosphate) 3'-pyrophosphohydrolase [Bacteroidales bacterium]|nr:bifunctional (p)ppGpp synthetase/guanosine-3',5'-bis(diphosphate) 3'-pyrophosphohydrolase [Bacteroidales bacterium]